MTTVVWIFERFWRVKRYLLILFTLLGIWFLILESQRVRGFNVNSWDVDHVADCAVVLTGGVGRVRDAIDLLSQRRVRKVIVSGANPQVSLRQIVPMWSMYGDLDERDVLLEKRSTTTYGNAQQALPLVEALRCRDVVLITSWLHMYRASRTFHAVFPPEISVTERAVVGAGLDPSVTELSLEVVKSAFYSVWAY